MLNKLAKLTKAFATQVVLEVSIETLKRLGIEEQVAEELIEAGLFDEEGDVLPPEVIDYINDTAEEEPEECQEAQEEVDELAGYLITKNYDLLPVPGAREGVFALCVQVVNIEDGNSYWVPYRYIQKKKIEPDVME